MRIAIKVNLFIITVILSNILIAQTIVDAWNRTNFELWNKTDKPVYYFFGGNTINLAAEKGRQYGFGKLEPHSYTLPQPPLSDWEPSGSNNILIVYVGDLPSSHVPALVVTFNEQSFGKTMYLDIRERNGEYRIEPQKGKLKGFFKSKGQTQRGYSLNKNVTIQDMNMKILLIPYLYGQSPVINQRWRGMKSNNKSVEE